MSVDEKRQLVYELSKQSHLATEVLQAWSRQEILQILCAEMGKERKYTGLTKVKIIETLLKIVSEKNSGEYEGKKSDSDCLPIQRSTKRQRKVDNPSRYVIPASNNMTSNNASGSSNSVNTKGKKIFFFRLKFINVLVHANPKIEIGQVRVLSTATICLAELY